MRPSIYVQFHCPAHSGTCPALLATGYFIIPAAQNLRPSRKLKCLKYSKIKEKHYSAYTFLDIKHPFHLIYYDLSPPCCWYLEKPAIYFPRVHQIRLQSRPGRYHCWRGPDVQYAHCIWVLPPAALRHCWKDYSFLDKYDRNVHFFKRYRLKHWQILGPDHFIWA